MEESDKKSSEEVKVKLKFKINKKILYWVVIPVLVLGLLFAGLFQQGFVGSWYNYVRRADINLTVVSKTGDAIQGATVTIGSKNGDTNESGQLTITGLIKGKNQFSITKKGFIDKTGELTLKKGSNDLGTYVLEDSPAAKVNATISLADYITETAITDATVSLDEFKPVVQNGGYLFSQIPVGIYSLKASKSGYNTLTKDVEVTIDNVDLGKTLMVKEGKVVFESNRDNGLRGIYYCDYDGTNQKYLISRVGDMEDYSPTVSSDQNTVAFVSTRDKEKSDNGTYKEYLYLVDIGTKKISKIDSGNLSVSSFAWSPTGRYLYYSTSYTYTNSVSRNSLYIYDTKVKTGRKIDGYRSIDAYTMQFSSDEKNAMFSGYEEQGTVGGYILTLSDYSIKKFIDQYISSSEMIAGGFSYTLYSNTDNKNHYYEYTIATGATNEVAAPTVTRNPGVVSPSGKLKAYMATRDGKRNLYVSSLDNTSEQKLTNLNNVAYTGVAWSKDGTYLTFLVSDNDVFSMYLVDSNGKATAKKIVDVNNSYSMGMGQ